MIQKEELFMLTPNFASLLQINLLTPNYFSLTPN